MLGDSVNINNFNCNPVVLKKFGKTSKITIFGPTRGHYGSRPKQFFFFFTEITKPDHRNVLFYQNIIFFG